MKDVHYSLMLPRFREWLTLLLIAALPFHALLITVVTKILLGPDHAPMGSLALWKEALLAVILLIAIVEIMKSYGLRVTSYGFDVIDLCIAGLLALAFILATRNSQLATSNFLYGFKYDFIPLIAFLILRRVPWSAEFQKRLMWLLLALGALLSAYAIVTLILPLGFFRALGYSNLHSLYVPDQPLPPYHLIAESAVRRVQGTFSGPNQLGVWLLIPLGVALSFVIGKKRTVTSDGLRVTGFLFGILALIFIVLLLSFSRSAWIGAAAMILVALALSFPRKTVQRLALWGAGAVVVVFLASLLVAPKVLFRLSSSRGHLEKPLKAIALMVEHPLGMGLGAAGPASNRTSDPCVQLRLQDDPSWAKSTPDLCVFLGEKQVQPLDRECHCPIVTENWYLQMGVELGVVGLIIYALLIGAVLWRLRVTGYPCRTFGGLRELATRNSQLATFLFFLGISIAAVFLHAWEDAAVAYTGWILVATSLSVSDTARAATRAANS